jgi:SAM-dependent methyltransferase
MTIYNKLQRIFLKQSAQTATPNTEFGCFTRDKLLIDPDDFRKRIKEFQDLENNSDPYSDYRNSFYFQYSSTYDSLIDTKAFFPGPTRSIDIMELIGPHLNVDKKDVLPIGFHNGAEIFWLLDRTDANIYGIEENRHFIAFCNFLLESYGLTDRVQIKQAEILDCIGHEERKFDLILLHGVIYMVKDPLHLIKELSGLLKPGGMCSIETYLIKDKRPIMQYVGDGTGWGDTFRYSSKFFHDILPDFGYKILHTIPYGNREVYVIQKTAD